MRGEDQTPDGVVTGADGGAGDGTDRRRLAAALEDREAELRGLFEGAAVPIAIVAPDGRLVRVNPAFCSLVGAEEDELLTRRFDQLVRPDDEGRSTAATTELLAGRRDAVVREERTVTRDGATLSVHASRWLIRHPDGRPKHLVVHVEDVTDRQRAEEHLARSESLRRVAGGVARVGGWSFDLRDGEVFWSDEMHLVTGDAPGRTPRFHTMLERFPEPDRERLDAAMASCVGTGQPYDLVLAYDRPDGHRIWARCVAEAVRDEDDEVVGLQGAMQDVTEERRAAAEIARLAERLTATMDSITDALFTVDRAWRFTYLNRRAEALLQRPPGDLLGRNLWEEFPFAVGGPLFDAYHRAVADQVTVTVEEYHYEPLGIWIEVRAFPSPEGLTVYFRDVGERRSLDLERQSLLEAERRARQQAQQARAVLEHQAAHDPLTGLCSRSEFVDRVVAAVPGGCAVLLVDLDDFKRVNEALGRTAGDELLLSVAHRLRELTRGDGDLARVGADEFAVLLPGGGGEGADRLAERIRQVLRTPFRAAGQRVYLQASVGLSLATADADGEQVLRDAEVALHAAKGVGGDDHRWYDPALDLHVKERLATVAELHDALEAEQFTLHFQPAFDLATGHPIGAEALARWQHPERGLVPPARFIPLAEDTGLIEPLGHWCLATALETARLWSPRDEDLTVWVNVAVRQLRRAGFARSVEWLLSTTGTSPHHLGVEITESAFAADASTVLAEVAALSELGVQIAIDDFGTGYSSLARLAELPVDLLKIDRSFVAALDTERGAATVDAIIGLGRALGVRVIAEGIETEAQLAALRAAGCGWASGFLLGRPVEAARLAETAAAGQALLGGRPVR
jgi:diguanylate cyclase (GGDEF)-like protein/PAS domain S-box-containing protein